MKCSRMTIRERPGPSKRRRVSSCFVRYLPLSSDTLLIFYIVALHTTMCLSHLSRWNKQLSVFCEPYSTNAPKLWTYSNSSLFRTFACIKRALYFLLLTWPALVSCSPAIAMSIVYFLRNRSRRYFAVIGRNEYISWFFVNYRRNGWETCKR